MNQIGVSQIYAAEPSGWECQLFGIPDGITIAPNKGNVPWFWWRWMQYLLIGNRWRKIPKPISDTTTNNECSIRLS